MFSNVFCPSKSKWSRNLKLGFGLFDQNSLRHPFEGFCVMETFFYSGGKPSFKEKKMKDEEEMAKLKKIVRKKRSRGWDQLDFSKWQEL